MWVGGCAAGGGGGGCGGLSARSLGGGGGACGLGVSGGGRYAGHGGCWRSWWCGVCRVLGQSWLRLVLPCLCAGRSGWRPGGPASCGWLVGLGRSRRAGGSLPCRRAWGPDGLAASGRGRRLAPAGAPGRPCRQPKAGPSAAGRSRADNCPPQPHGAGCRSQAVSRAPRRRQRQTTPTPPTQTPTHQEAGHPHTPQPRGNTHQPGTRRATRSYTHRTSIHPTTAATNGPPQLTQPTPHQPDKPGDCGLIDCAVWFGGCVGVAG